MTNRVLALAATAVKTATRQENREAAATAGEVGLAASDIGQLNTSDEMFRIAARLVMSMKVGEQVIACTGLTADDPSASFALHVGIALARLGHGPVLVVDANVHAPRLHTLTGLPLAPGISELLNDSELGDAVIRSTSIIGLEILPAGEATTAIKAALSTPVLGKRLESFRRYRFVVMDVGPILTASESLLFASLSDVIVATLAVGERSRKDVARLKAETDLLKARMLGVVLTEIA
jgi:Mrp family chromosome partitioning ATPase